MPLYTTIFLPGEYGIVTELYAFVAFLNILYTYGLETAYFRFSSEESDIDYFSLSFISISFTSILLSGSLYLLSEEIAVLLKYPGNGHLIKWLALILAIDAIVAIPFARLRKEGKAIYFASFKLLNISLNIVLNIFFLVICPSVIRNNPDSFLTGIYNPTLGVGYVFLSNLIANACYLILLAPTIIKVKLNVNTDGLRQMLNYSWPILIIGFAGVTNEMLSRSILKYRLPDSFYEGYTNLEALGIFGACYKLSVFMTLAVQAFRYSFEPFFFNRAKEKDSPILFSKIMTAFVLFTSTSWVIISLLLPVIAPLFLRQPSYLEGLSVVPWLLGGGVMLGIFYNLSVWYKLSDKTKYGAVISLVGALLTFVLNWIMIPILGYDGSAIATFIVYFIMVILSYLWGRGVYKVPYDLKRIAFYLVFAGFIILFDQKYSSGQLFSILLIVVYLILLFLADRKHIKAFLR